jgi:hypothetical protein
LKATISFGSLFRGISLMRYKKKLIILLLLIVVLTAIQYTLPYHLQAVYLYNVYIFHPYQSFRNIILHIIPISVGDILYIAAAIMLLITVSKWILYFLKVKTYKHELLTSMLHFFITITSIYIWFVIGWGGNYYKPTLSTYWELDKSTWTKKDSLIAFDKFLLGKLNEYAPAYGAINFKETNKRAKQYYKDYTDASTRKKGLHVKPSVFGYFMEYVGIQGYYNPFTGEAQVNKFLPSFMLPFVVTHEMAHQAGIAAEDDANLLAYAIGTHVNDNAFRYSSYFNIWLYAQSRLRMLDSTEANKIKAQLNPLSLSHIDTLRAIRIKYKGVFSNYSGQLYDTYLKMHNQKKGIRSYNEVTISAWALERQRAIKKENIIHVP